MLQNFHTLHIKARVRLKTKLSIFKTKPQQKLNKTTTKPQQNNNKNATKTKHPI
jgi:hypothetical protein